MTPAGATASVLSMRRLAICRGTWYFVFWDSRPVPTRLRGDNNHQVSHEMISSVTSLVRSRLVLTDFSRFLTHYLTPLRKDVKTRIALEPQLTRSRTRLVTFAQLKAQVHCLPYAPVSRTHARPYSWIRMHACSSSCASPRRQRHRQQLLHGPALHFTVLA